MKKSRFSHRHLTPKAVYVLSNPCEMLSGQNGTRTSFFPSDYVDFRQSRSFHRGNIIIIKSPTIDDTQS